MAFAFRRKKLHDPARVARAMHLFARYDSLRLHTYRQCESLDGRIRVERFGEATALRFDDVGYFNRIYAPAVDAGARLPEFEDFYRGSPFGCELVGPPSEIAGPLEAACRGRGWREGKPYAWLGGPLPPPSAAAENDGLTIRPPSPPERIAFLRCYLRGFEAAPSRFEDAIRNMRHLFSRPELYFLMAWRYGRPAGVGMLYREERMAILCAGATVPEERRSGCHAALLEARLRLAAELGCQEIYSWAVSGGQSHANIERTGLETLGVTATWQLAAQRAVAAG